MKLFSIILGSIALICLLFLGTRFILNLKRPLKLSDTHFLLDRLYAINSPDAYLTITIAGSNSEILMDFFKALFDAGENSKISFNLFRG